MFDRWILALIMRMQISKEERERGDIPGWVMITLMTVAIATAIWTLVGDNLLATLEGVLEAVTPNNGD